MTLWSGYEFNKADAIPDPIIDEIPVIHLSVDIKPISETKTTAGTYYMFGREAILWSANAFAMMEMFGKGTSITWMYYFDEFHWIWQGEAEVVYSLASTGNTKKITMHVKEGDFFVTPRGSIVEFKIGPDKDLKRVCGIMPGYALHPRFAEQMKKEREAAEKARKEGK
jgi:mannose-6-phosphate isomerase-like protein (cupin superfamily)